MKKVMVMVLLAVFTLATFATVIATKAEALPLCTRYCDQNTCLYWECCPYKKSPNSKKVFWDCYWSDPCCIN